MLLPARAATLAAVALLAAGPLAAQEEDLGFIPGRLMFTIGGSVGTAGVSCVKKCSAERHTGPSLLIRGGSQIAEHFTVLLEANLFRSDFTSPNGDPGRWTMSWYLLGVQWFPNVEETFFIHAGIGLGVSRTNVTFPDVGPLPLNASNVGGTVGIGKEFYFREDMAITAYLSMHITGRSQAQIGRADSGAKISTDLVHAGLAFTIF